MLISALFSLLCVSLVNARRVPSLIYQYPDTGTWIENMAPRRNGTLILTSVNSPGGISLLNPFDGTPPTLVSNDFDGLNSTLGIVETAPDLFYVLASNFSLSPPYIGTQPGTNSVYKVDFRNSSFVPAVSRLGIYPQAEFLNGMTKFNDTILLAVDSTKGAIWSVNTETAAMNLVIQSSKLAGRPSTPGGFSEGINGAQFLDGTIYFTNSQRYTFGKLDLDANVQPAGPIRVYATPVPEKGILSNWDDFALSPNGRYAYVATEIGNSVQRVDLRTGRCTIFSGYLNSTEIAEPTSATFGRTYRDRNTLYVATAGGTGSPIYVDHQKQWVGAQIMAIDLSYLF